MALLPSTWLASEPAPRTNRAADDWLVSAWCLGAVVATVLFVPSSLEAANGDVQRVSTVLSATGPSDLTFDTANSVFWVCTRSDGSVYRLNQRLDTIEETRSNPHGTGAFPNFISTVGVAHRSTDGTVLLLAQQRVQVPVQQIEWRIQDLDGGNIFNLMPSDPTSALLRGLTFDSTTNELWTLDANNDELVRFDLSGNVTQTIPLPRSNIMADVDLFGEGVAYFNTGSQSLYAPFGDLFEVAPSELLQILPDGTATGIELPLANVPGNSNRGFEIYQAGAQIRAVVITGDGNLVELEHTVPVTPPPSWLDCILTQSNEVVLTWQNNGPGIGSRYNGPLRILRDGNPVATVPGNVNAFTDANPQPGTGSYTVQPTDPPGSPQSSPCNVTVGTSGLVDWKLLSGTRPFDVARDPTTGDLYVTDSVEGSIFVYDEDFNLQGQIASPWSDPGPIVFLPEIEITIFNGGLEQIIVTDLLAVGRTTVSENQLIALVDLNGNPQTTLTFSSQISGAVFGGLTYDVDRQEFSTIELSTKNILVFDNVGNRLHACFPRGQGIPLPPLDMGISFDGLAQTYLATFEDGSLRDLFAEPDLQGGCVVAQLQFALSSSGAGFNTQGYLGGIQMETNTLLVLGHQANAIFRILLQPFTAPFERGDVDRNGSINISDAVLIANHLFANDPMRLACQDAADTNDDGELDIGDPVYLVFYLFASGSAPPAPFGSEGVDPTFRDNLGCES